ncbi:MAG: SAM-dependent methyltransferase [Legionellales bacterium]|nr:SAM-dependent methyltransferase [Legionellales bacterium]
MSAVEIIKQKLLNKPVTFEQYMKLALYDPSCGYYHHKNTIFGKNGDYITAPEISPIFSKVLANHCKTILQDNPGNILEFGAGSGKMSSVIVKELTSSNIPFNKYQIIEPSPKLRQLQKFNILSKYPEIAHKLEWLTNLPKYPWQGIILANEVLDSMPINRFHKSNKIQEYYVANQNNHLALVLSAISNKNFLNNIHEIIDNFLKDVDDYDIEINFYLKGWLQAIFDFMSQGTIIIFDYGFPEHEFYHQARNKGTIMCHSKHTTNSDPLKNVGQQDITAHVNFSQLANLSHQIGFTIQGYTNQANFLLNSEILQLVDTSNSTSQFNHGQQIKLLTMPSEMGEIFKVVQLNKNSEITLSGFKRGDLRHTL